MAEQKLINNKNVVTYMIDAKHEMSVFDFSTPAKKLSDIKMPGIGEVSLIEGTNSDTEFFFDFVSFTDPGSSFLVDMTNFSVKPVRKSLFAESSKLNLSDFITD